MNSALRNDASVGMPRLHRMPMKCLQFASAIAPLVLSVLTGLMPAHVNAQVPNLLNYQGRLSDSTGNPQNGAFTIQFAVYDAETGGNQLPSGTPWGETQSVTVTNGVFNVLLGSVTALPANLFNDGPSDASGPLRFLQVTVGGEVLSPRRRIASAAYAIQPSTSNTAGTAQLYAALGVSGGVGYENYADVPGTSYTLPANGSYTVYWRLEGTFLRLGGWSGSEGGRARAAVGSAISAEVSALATTFDIGGKFTGVPGGSTFRMQCSGGRDNAAGNPQYCTLGPTPTWISLSILKQ